jgi:uncharacterized membrane protein
MTILKATHKHATQRFWLWWLLATVAGTIIGMAIVFLGLTALLNNLHQAAYGFVIGAVFGATVGTAQWLVLRRVFDRVGWWVLLTFVGWVAFWELDAMNLLFAAKGIAFIPDLLNVAIFGGILGVLQWLLLRQKIQSAGWWVLASMAGAMLGSLVADAINTALQSDSPIDFLTSSVVWAIITGICMMWLIRRSSSPITGSRSK